MKKLVFTFLILLISGLMSLPVLADEFKSADDAIKKLTTYSVADIEGDKERLKKRRPLKIDEMFNDLESAAKYLEKNPPTEDLAYQLERVSLITFIHDPSAFAIELILPAYQKHKDLFEKAAKKLHSVDRELILETLQSHDQSSKEGQG